VKVHAGHRWTRTRGAGLLTAIAAAACAAALAGCGSSGSSTASGSQSPGAAGSTSSAAPVVNTPTAAPSPTMTPPATAPAGCATSSLTVKLAAPEGYAGGTYVQISFTNASSASCTLYGYPGVSLVTGPPYAQVGLAAERDTTSPVKLVTLTPGATATALLQIVDAHNFGSSTCSPVQATNLRIYPPNQTASVFLPDTSYGCGDPVQVLFIGAVQAQGLESPQATG
jgi:Protein of unknown function (DUF4232)